MLFDVPLIAAGAGITPILVPELPEGLQLLQMSLDGAPVLIHRALIEEDGGTCPLGQAPAAGAGGRDENHLMGQAQLVQGLLDLLIPRVLGRPVEGNHRSSDSAVPLGGSTPRARSGDREEVIAAVRKRAR